MNMIKLCDVTMKQVADGFSLSFKEKIELAKLLDKLGVAVIELEGIQNPRIDSLRIKSIAAAVVNSIVAVPVQLTADSPAQVWNAVQQAKAPRLQVCGAVSAVPFLFYFEKTLAFFHFLLYNIKCNDETPRKITCLTERRRLVKAVGRAFGFRFRSVR